MAWAALASDMTTTSTERLHSRIWSIVSTTVRAFDCIAASYSSRVSGTSAISTTP